MPQNWWTHKVYYATVCLSVHLSVHPSIHPSVRPSVCWYPFLHDVSKSLTAIKLKLDSTQLPRKPLRIDFGMSALIFKVTAVTMVKFSFQIRMLCLLYLFRIELGHFLYCHVLGSSSTHSQYCCVSGLSSTQWSPITTSVGRPTCSAETRQDRHYLAVCAVMLISKLPCYHSPSAAIRSLHYESIFHVIMSVKCYRTWKYFPVSQLGHHHMPDRVCN